MLLLDVNVLLAAHRADHPQHATVRPWLDGLLSSDNAVTVPTVVWGSFLRLATHRRIFNVSTPRDDAFAFMHAICSQPSSLQTTPGARHLALLQRLCGEADATGDLVPDAVLAALAVEHGCEVVSLDRDFARFASVRTIRPE